MWLVWDVTVRSPAADAPPDGPTLRSWLCFQAGKERRRLMDYPAAWTELPEDELARLCEGAVKVS